MPSVCSEPMIISFLRALENATLTRLQSFSNVPTCCSELLRTRDTMMQSLSLPYNRKKLIFYLKSIHCRGFDGFVRQRIANALHLRIVRRNDAN